MEDPRAVRATDAVRHTLDRLNAATPGSKTAFNRIGTTGGNVVGGVPLGLATAADGSVHGARNLYVVDSSLLHGSSGAVPPALTISAVAARVASLLVASIAGA